MATIMHQYGSLVAEFGELSPASEWCLRGLKPTESGLSKTHKIKWSEMPERFMEWVTTNKVSGFDRAIEIIKASVGTVLESVRIAI